jgi:hypothetical protein
MPQPRRPTDKLADNPPSATRVYRPAGCAGTPNIKPAGPTRRVESERFNTACSNSDITEFRSHRHAIASFGSRLAADLLSKP